MPHACQVGKKLSQTQAWLAELRQDVFQKKGLRGRIDYLAGRLTQNRDELEKALREAVGMLEGLECKVRKSEKFEVRCLCG